MGHPFPFWGMLWVGASRFHQLRKTPGLVRKSRKNNKKQEHKLVAPEKWQQKPVDTKSWPSQTGRTKKKTENKSQLATRGVLQTNRRHSRNERAGVLASRSCAVSFFSVASRQQDHGLQGRNESRSQTFSVRWGVTKWF